MKKGDEPAFPKAKVTMITATGGTITGRISGFDRLQIAFMILLFGDFSGPLDKATFTNCEVTVIAHEEKEAGEKE